MVIKRRSYATSCYFNLRFLECTITPYHNVPITYTNESQKGGGAECLHCVFLLHGLMLEYFFFRKQGLLLLLERAVQTVGSRVGESMRGDNTQEMICGST